MIVKALLARMEVGHFAVLELKRLLMDQLTFQIHAMEITFDVMEIGLLLDKVLAFRLVIEWQLIGAARCCGRRLPMMGSELDFIFTVVVGVCGLFAIEAIVASTSASAVTVLYGRIGETILRIRRFDGWRRWRQLGRGSIAMNGTAVWRRRTRLAIANGDGCRIWLGRYITSLLLHFKTIVK